MKLCEDMISIRILILLIIFHNFCTEKVCHTLLTLGSERLVFLNEINTASIDRLKQMCESYDLPQTGNKEVLKKRLTLLTEKTLEEVQEIERNKSKASFNSRVRDTCRDIGSKLITIESTSPTMSSIALNISNNSEMFIGGFLIFLNNLLLVELTRHSYSKLFPHCIQAKLCCKDCLNNVI